MKASSKSFSFFTSVSLAVLMALTGCAIDNPIDYTTESGSTIPNDSSNGNGSNASAVSFSTTADLDGDGRQDLLVSMGSTNQLALLRNNSSVGSPQTDTAILFPVGTQPAGLASADFDNDGKIDVAVVNSGSNSVSVFPNNASSGSLSSSSLGAEIQLAVGSTPLRIVAADFDGDGKVDLAVSNSASNTVSLLKNTSSSGSISFAAAEDLSVGSQPQGIVAGDLDGDGKPELAVALKGSDQVEVYGNQATVGALSASSFSSANSYGAGSQPVGARLSDLDGDGKLDLLVSNAAGNSLSLLQNQSTAGNISFQANVDFAAGSSPQGVAGVDLDGDGLAEVVSVNQGSNTVSALRNAVNASTTTPVVLQNPQSQIVLSGTSVEFSASAEGASPMSYQWYKDGNLISGATGSTYSVSSVQNSDAGEYSVRVTNGYGNVDSEQANLQVTSNSSLVALLEGGNRMVYRKGSPAKAVDPLLRLTNTTGTAISSAKVSIDSGYQSSQDVLALPSVSGVTSSWDSGTGILSLSGSLNAEQWQDVLRQVTYQNTSTNPSTTPRAINFVIGEAIYDPTTKHYYESVSAPGIRWTDAKAAAEARSHFGIQGYLVTITSQEEDQLAFSKINAIGWIGASDAAQEGVWKWVTGPESGTQFWSGSSWGSSYGGAYENWGSGEPNNAGNEDYGHFRSDGKWNDVPDVYSAVQGYIVEYGGMPNDPILQLAAAATVEVLNSSVNLNSTSLFSKADYPTGSQPVSLNAEDLDGDGKRDLVVANTGSGSLSILRNTSVAGSVSFASKVDISLP